MWAGRVALALLGVHSFCYLPETMSGTPKRVVVGPRLWAVVLTGIPFGVFKVGGGLAAYDDINAGIGLGIIAWGLLDILINLLSIPFPQSIAPCLLANLGRQADRRGARGQEQLWLAVDTLLSFAIVSSMIWFRRIGALPPWLVRAWEISVVANILGVGISRFWQASAGIRHPAPPGSV